MKHRIFLAILAIALVCVLLISCNEIMPPESSVPPDTNSPSLPDLSVPEISTTDNSSSVDNSVPETSEPEQPDESTVPEVSETDETYIWYGDGELRGWYLDFIDEFTENKGDGIHVYTKDDKHFGFYHTLEGGLINAVGGELFYKYTEIFNNTDDINLAAFCEYFDITLEEYRQVYAGDFEEFGKVKYGEKPGGRVMLYIQIHQYDAWFTEQYWNHPDLLIKEYELPEIDSYYTSVSDRNGYTRRYYLIDRLLIEYIGVDEFKEWLEEKEDKDQNILEFVKDYDVTREIYDELYKDVSFKPYNPDYLFGTPEMQEEYFTVHPVEELGKIEWNAD